MYYYCIIPVDGDDKDGGDDGYTKLIIRVFYVLNGTSNDMNYNIIL